MEFKDLELVFTDHSILVMPGEPSVRFFKNDSIDVVMMDWETPLMKRHAEVMCRKPNSDVLEIGFGMGISAMFIQDLKPKSHTIVECHPQVLKMMEEWIKDKDNNHLRLNKNTLQEAWDNDGRKQFVKNLDDGSN